MRLEQQRDSAPIDKALLDGQNHISVHKWLSNLSADRSDIYDPTRHFAAMSTD
jgi:hypothetical protein